jgi:hypothetical protein
MNEAEETTRARDALAQAEDGARQNERLLDLTRRMASDPDDPNREAATAFVPVLERMAAEWAITIERAEPEPPARRARLYGGESDSSHSLA